MFYSKCQMIGMKFHNDKYSIILFIFSLGELKLVYLDKKTPWAGQGSVIELRAPFSIFALTLDEKKKKWKDAGPRFEAGAFLFCPPSVNHCHPLII